MRDLTGQYMWTLLSLIALLFLISCGTSLSSEADIDYGAIGPTARSIPATTPHSDSSSPPQGILAPTLTPRPRTHTAIDSSKDSTIQGTVLALNGTPIYGAGIDLDPIATNGTPFEAIGIFSDEQGQYIWHVGPGRYLLVITAEGYQTGTQEITVTAGMSTTITTTLVTK